MVKLKNNLKTETKLKCKCKLKIETETGKLFQKGITVVVSGTCTKQFTAAVNVGLTSVLMPLTMYQSTGVVVSCLTTKPQPLLSVRENDTENVNLSCTKIKIPSIVQTNMNSTLTFAFSKEVMFSLALVCLFII